MDDKQRTIADAIMNYLSETLRRPREEIGYDTPLFGEGIGLDSVDSLEIIAGMDTLFGVSLMGVNDGVLKDVSTISKYVIDHPGYKERA